MARRVGDVFLPLDVTFFEDDKTLDAGEAASWLYLAMCCKAKQNLTDGALTSRQIERLGIKRWQDRLTRLLDVGLIKEEGPGRYLIPAYIKRNKTRAQMDVEREEKRAGAILGNHRRWHIDKPDHGCPHCQISDRMSDA